jgi:probable phosphoglycerate mutase
VRTPDGTDLPLIRDGEMAAARIGGWLPGKQFALVFVSPLTRARETCRIAGYGDVAEVDPNLREWDFGAYEGRTTADVRKERPDWSLWRDGVPEGETIEHVAARAQRVIGHALQAEGDVALFAHGHILRIIAACWLNFPPSAGASFALTTAWVSRLGYERENRVIALWNFAP